LEWRPAIATLSARFGLSGGTSTDLRQLQATMPLTPSVIEDCRGGERW
jgi:hypothetical protein